MKTLLTTLLSFLLFATTFAQNTATPFWTAAFGLQDTVLKIPTAIDPLRNLYIAGSTIDNSTGPDILLAKYDPYGNPLWTASYTGSGYYRDQASAIAIDNNLNIIVGGFTYTNSTNNYDYLVLKYDSAGTLLWTYTYNGPGSAADIVSAITTSGGDIYITGASIGSLTGFDYTTIKLNGSGTVLWNNRYNYLGNDLPFDIDISGTNVFVNGGSQSTITDWDYAQLIYTTSGTPYDTIRTTGTGVGFDHASQAVTDVQGYVYITGAYATTSNGLDFKTIKLDQQGNIKWISTFDGLSHQDDQANSVGVDYYGNVYVTGQTKNASGNEDYCTIKYDSSGTQEWVRYYNYNNDDKANKLIVGDDNNIYITGESSNGSNKDFATIAYNIDGDTLWQIRFNGAYNNDDMATDIAKDGDFVYVSGQSKINSTTYQYITIAYGEATFEEIPDAFNETTGNTWYYPNNGQLANDTGGVVSNITYYSQIQSPAIYFDDYSTSYVFSHIDNDTTTIDTIQRVDMNFIKDIPLVPIPGGIPLGSAMMYPDEIYSVGKPSSHYQNFYLPQCPDGVTDVHGFKTLFREEIYKGIDIYYNSNEGGLKHYFVIKKTNPNLIVMRFTGADSISHSLGTYSIHTAVGTLKYDTLVAYEVDASGTIIPNTMQPIDIYADTANGYWHFTPINYNFSNTLVIMAKQNAQQQASPNQIDNLTWCTYVGSQRDGLKDIKTDAQNNTFVTGLAGSPYYPVANGISLIYFNEYSNMGIAKFDSLGILKWSSVLGSNYASEGTAIELGTSGSVFVTGYTNGTTFPIFPLNNTNNYFRDSIYSGNKDLVIVELNDLGNEVLWSSYYGSSGKEIGLDLVKDLADNLYIYGEGDSLSPKVTNPLGTAYQVNKGGGLLLKFNPSKQLIWATNLDSLETDTLDWQYTPFTGAIAADNKRNIYVTSNVKNGVIPEINAGTHGGSNYDSYLIKLNVSTNNIEWSTRIGSSQDDFSHDLAVNNTTGDIYLCGRNNDDIGDFPFKKENLSCYYDTTPNTGSNRSNAFILKFDTDSGTLKWSTYYNGNEKDAFYGITLDNQGRIFLGGTTASTILDWPGIVPNGVYSDQITNNNATTGWDDGLLVAFNPDGSLIWASFFGGIQHDEFVHALAVNGLNQLLIDGSTGSAVSALFPLADGYGVPYFDDINEFPFFRTCGYIARFDLLPLYNGLNNLTKDKNNLLLYPNPSNNFINLTLKNDFSKQGKLWIYNTLGECVIEQNVPAGGKEITVLIQNLMAGFYIAKISDCNKSLQTSFVKY